MTLGIGVLCSSKPVPCVPRPDAMVLIGDTIGSTDIESAEAQHEMYFNPVEKLFGICIGRINRAAGLFHSIQKELLQSQDRNVHACEEALNKAVHGHRAEHFQSDMLPPETIPKPSDPSLLDAWQQYDVGIHLLVGTFSSDGKALLYLVAQMGNTDQRVHRVYGDATIGEGGYSASFWLNFRQQAPGRSLRQSAYHAYEAARLTARPPGLDGGLEMIVATKDKAFHLAARTPEPEGSYISLLELESMLEKFGPRDTDRALGHADSSVAAAGKSN
jgi:hypothetical protein